MKKKFLSFSIGVLCGICLCFNFNLGRHSSCNYVSLAALVEHCRPSGRAIQKQFLYKSKRKGLWYFAAVNCPQLRAAAEPGQGLAEPVKGPAQGLAEPVQGPAQGLAEPVQRPAQPVQVRRGPSTPLRAPRGRQTCPGAPARARHVRVARIPRGPLRGRWPPVRNLALGGILLATVCAGLSHWWKNKNSRKF